MAKNRNVYPFLLSCFLVFFYPEIAVSEESSIGIEQAIHGEHRSDASRARDIYRHPLETLEFFGINNNMTVVEIWPGGGGWYTEILASFLSRNGKLYAAHFDPNSSIQYFKTSFGKFQQKIGASPDVYKNVVVTVLQPPDRLDIAPAGSADRVLTFRNVHNWMKSGTALKVFTAMFKALKPGGVLGVVEHRGLTSQAQDPQAKSGYVREDYVIDMARQAGFIFVASSEINANLKDTRDHPKGVWTLPPTLRLNQQDREKYLAIGESDRMTLKFRKRD